MPLLAPPAPCDPVDPTAQSRITAVGHMVGIDITRAPAQAATSSSHLFRNSRHYCNPLYTTSMPYIHTPPALKLDTKMDAPNAELLTAFAAYVTILQLFLAELPLTSIQIALLWQIFRPYSAMRREDLGGAQSGDLLAIRLLRRSVQPPVQGIRHWNH